ncbi:DUF2057 family protein [Vibrio sp. EA2]|uniref:DUF2057 family protein n=1 Tax=Vibrio sp. EA2 TaxID=3079860 RepID=UPI0029495BA5|nr:DUF2057 family protein [Vibrio sp. EA2]MDV6250620.1 DUF2057 family protein [Vibrio sp. EA2]
MNLNIWTTAFALSVVATTASAENETLTTFQAEQGVEVLFINSTDADDLTSPFKLPAGSNQLVIRVDKAIGRGDKRTQIKSAPYILNVEVGAGSLYIDSPSFKDARDAEKLFSNEQLDWNVTLNDQAIDYTQYKMPGNKGMFPYANLDQQLAKYNLANGVQVTNATIAETSVSRSVDSPELNQAKNVYLQLSDSDRTAFLKWLSEE